MKHTKLDVLGKNKARSDRVNLLKSDYHIIYNLGHEAI